MAKLELPSHWDWNTATTLLAGILIAVTLKKLVVNIEEVIFGIFPGSLPEWAVIGILLFIIYYLLKYKG